MHVATGTQIVPGTYAVAVGAGGIGSSQPGPGAGNLSWITPRRTISLSEPTGAFVTGETLTGGTSTTRYNHSINITSSSYNN
jgi:hypothetical protein